MPDGSHRGSAGDMWCEQGDHWRAGMFTAAIHYIKDTETRARALYCLKVTLCWRAKEQCDTQQEYLPPRPWLHQHRDTLQITSTSATRSPTWHQTHYLSAWWFLCKENTSTTRWTNAWSDPIRALSHWRLLPCRKQSGQGLFGDDGQVSQLPSGGCKLSVQRSCSCSNLHQLQ